MKYVNNINLQYPEVIMMEKNEMIFNFSYGLQRIAMNDEYYYYDGLGSVTQMIDEEGTILREYAYTVDGERTTVYNPYVEDNMYGYRGEAHTADGLQYLRARYYDPRLGRFLMWDDDEGKKRRPKSKNRYTYGENNSNKHRDPSGRAVAGKSSTATIRTPLLVSPVVTTTVGKSNTKTPTPTPPKSPVNTGGSGSVAKATNTSVTTNTAVEMMIISNLLLTGLQTVSSAITILFNMAINIFNNIYEKLVEDQKKVNVINQLDDSIKELFFGDNPILDYRTDFEITNDGMFLIKVDLDSIIIASGLDETTMNQIGAPEKRWDDLRGWYLYGVIDSDEVITYSLVKMHESTTVGTENFTKTTFTYDETGFSLSFIELKRETISSILLNPNGFVNELVFGNTGDKSLINAVRNFTTVEKGKDMYEKNTLGNYFLNIESEGVRLLYEVYTDKILLTEFDSRKINQETGEEIGYIYGSELLIEDIKNQEQRAKIEEMIKSEIITIHDGYIRYEYDPNNISEIDREMAIYFRAYNKDYYEMHAEVIHHIENYSPETIYGTDGFGVAPVIIIDMIQAFKNKSASVSDHGVGEEHGSYYTEKTYQELYEYWYPRIGGN